MIDGHWTLQGRRVALDGGTAPASIAIRGGRIVAVGAHGDDLGAGRVVDAGDLAVLPGLVDIHVHINEPGRADWEGFETGTRAALAGGSTTIVDMPLNSAPVTTTVEALAAKRAATAGALRVDCGFFGGIVPGNVAEIEPMAAAGVLGFKAFLCHSGIDEFPGVDEADLRAAMPILARLGLPLLAHAEVVGEGPPPAADRRSYAAHVASRPVGWELSAIDLLIRLCRETGCRVHVVHLAAAEALPKIAAAKDEGLPLTVETCPHYLAFAAEEIPDADPRFKCTPPIRSAADREGLWDGLRSGLIDTIGSDHSPAPPALKCLDSGDVAGAWGGISSLQFSLGVVWREASRRGFTLDDVARWMARSPARVVGLDGRKGTIRAGADADLLLVDPEATFSLSSGEILHRHPATPYEGRPLRGRVARAFLRGVEVAPPGPPTGRTIDAGPAPLRLLNAMSRDGARAALLRCCGSTRWADRMAAARPFRDLDELRSAADSEWSRLDRSDMAEAFAAHPRIGDLRSLDPRHAGTAGWAGGEQSGVAGADGGTIEALARANARYESRFGRVFLICATGKSAAEMLDAIERRMAGDDDEAEWAATARAQAEITRIRLGKLLS